MVDVNLMKRVVEVLDSESSLVMIGDANQLPPVGAGQLFRDLLEAGKFPSMELTDNFRQSEGSGIVRAAGEIIVNTLSITDSPEHAVPRHDTLLLTVGRGTSDPDANSNICKVARMLWEGLGFGWGEVAYSGVTFPLVRPALNHAVKLGFRRIIVFPYFLFTGVLVQRIYSTTDEVAAKHPEIEFLKAGYLNDHPQVIDTMADRVREKVPGAQIRFESDPERQRILDELERPIDDGNARREWDWQPEYDLGGLVEDFLKEMALNPERYG